MESVLDMVRSRIRGGFALKIAAMESALKVYEARISAADPRRIVGRGYALVLDEAGRVVKGAAGRSEGDRLSLMFADGTLDCLIENVR